VVIKLCRHFFYFYLPPSGLDQTVTAVVDKKKYRVAIKRNKHIEPFTETKVQVLQNELYNFETLHKFIQETYIAH
jgi:hypothetical protein